MRYKILILYIISISLFSCRNEKNIAFDCLPSDLQEGVIAFYPFNNGNLNDESTYNNNLTNSTSATTSTDRDGNSNCAYFFKDKVESTDFLKVSATEFLNELPVFSISIWYQPSDSTRSYTKFECLINRGEGSHCPNREGEWSLALYDCRIAVFAQNHSVWANTYTDPDTSSCRAEIEALTNKWHHIVAVKKDSNYKIYFNGHLDNENIGEGTCVNPYIAQDIGDLFIGKFFTGYIDDIIIYNREISQAEVTTLYELKPCCN